MQASIRGGLDQDIDGCVDLWTRVIVARDGLETAPAVRERARAVFRRPVVRFALTGAAPDGFALTVEDGPRVALLSRICVDPSATSQGLGAALLGDAVEHARAAGFDRLRLDVRQSNARAIGLYSRAGFEPVGEPWQYDHGDLFVTWSLDLDASRPHHRSS